MQFKNKNLVSRFSKTIIINFFILTFLIDMSLFNFVLHVYFITKQILSFVFLSQK